jgi:hypothetical protein
MAVDPHWKGTPSWWNYFGRTLATVLFAFAAVGSLFTQLEYKEAAAAILLLVAAVFFYPLAGANTPTASPSPVAAFRLPTDCFPRRLMRSMCRTFRISS